MSQSNTSLAEAMVERHGYFSSNPQQQIAALKELLEKAYTANDALRSRLAMSESGILSEVHMPEDDGTLIAYRLNDLIVEKWGEKLTRQQMSLVTVLGRAYPRLINRFQVLELIPGHRGMDPERNLKLAHVMVCNIRRKTCYEAIETKWGDGWRLGAPLLDMIASIKDELKLAA